VEISDSILGEHFLDEKRADGIGRERADPEDHDVEQTLGAGAGMERTCVHPAAMAGSSSTQPVDFARRRRSMR